MSGRSSWYQSRSGADQQQWCGRGRGGQKVKSAHGNLFRTSLRAEWRETVSLCWRGQTERRSSRGAGEKMGPGCHRCRRGAGGGGQRRVSVGEGSVKVPAWKKNPTTTTVHTEKMYLTDAWRPVPSAHQLSIFRRQCQRKRLRGQAMMLRWDAGSGLSLGGKEQPEKSE